MEVSDLVYIDSTGFHFPDYPTVFALFQDKYKAVRGADVYIESDSMDGQNLGIFAKASYDTAAFGAAIYNSFSPVTAQGIGLSRLVKLNAITRMIPTFSTAILTITGQAATVITNGVAIDTLQQKWNLPASVTIPGPGTITVTATAQILGAIAANANTINSIFTPTLGWQTVNNAASATPGSPVEPDFNLRLRQKQSTAIPSLTVFDGTVGGVENLTGVTKVRGYENDTGSTDANGIPAHTICLIVKGGDSVAIAQEIALKKTTGTGTFGDVSELVYDAHGMPLTINFKRPEPITIKVEITISTTTGWTTDYEILIANAVSASINLNRIGDNVLITKLFSPAYLLGTPAGQTFDITLLRIGDPSLGTVNIVLDFDEEAVCDPVADVTIIVT